MAVTITIAAARTISIVTMPTALPPGETCRLEFRGCSWSAVNAGLGVIAAGSRARIERVDGLTLVLRADA